MKRYWEAGALLAVVLMPLPAADNKEVAKPPAAEGRGGALQSLKPPPKINDPGASVAQWLLQMTPEQRERALEKFPPARQAQIRERLEKLDSRPPQQKQRLIQQYRMLASLPPDKQLLVRHQIQAFNQMPDERKLIVWPELQRLDRMPEDKREERLASEEFKGKFTPAEQRMMEDLSRYWPLR